MGGLPRKPTLHSPTVTLTGVARFDDGAPVPKFDLVLSGVERDGANYHRVTTNDGGDGFFEIHGVPIGAQLEVAMASLASPLFMTGSRSATRVSVQETRQDVGVLVVERTKFATVRGRVVTPAERQTDQVTVESTRYGWKWTVAPNEPFEIDVPIDSTRFSASGAGLSREQWHGGRSRFSPEEIVEMPPLSLSDTRQIRGRVELSNGQPAPNAVVCLGGRFAGSIVESKPVWRPDPHWDSTATQHTDRVSCDESGVFSFDCAPHEKLKLLAWLGDQIGLECVASDAPDGLLVTLGPGCVARGNVAAPPEQRPEVSLYSIGDLGERTISVSAHRCEVNGDFATLALPPGEYSLESQDSRVFREVHERTTTAMTLDPAQDSSATLELFVGRTIRVRAALSKRIHDCWAWLTGRPESETGKGAIERTLVRSDTGPLSIEGTFTNVPNGTYQFVLRVVEDLDDGTGRRLITKRMVTIEDETELQIAVEDEDLSIDD